MLEDLQDDRTLNDVQRCVIWLSDVRALWCYGDGDMRFRNTCLEMAYLNGKHCFLREWNYRFGHVKHCYHELPTLYNGSQMQWKFIGRSTNNQKPIFISVKHKERLYLKSVGELVDLYFLVMSIEIIISPLETLWYHFTSWNSFLGMRFLIMVCA